MQPCSPRTPGTVTCPGRSPRDPPEQARRETATRDRSVPIQDAARFDLVVSLQPPDAASASGRFVLATTPLDVIANCGNRFHGGKRGDAANRRRLPSSRENRLVSRTRRPASDALRGRSRNPSGNSFPAGSVVTHPTTHVRRGLFRGLPEIERSPLEQTASSKRPATRKHAPSHGRRKRHFRPRPLTAPRRPQPPATGGKSETRRVRVRRRLPGDAGDRDLTHTSNALRLMDRGVPFAGPASVVGN